MNQNVTSCRKEGILFVAIDHNRPLSDQGPFDIVLYKVSVFPFGIRYLIKQRHFNVGELTFHYLWYKISRFVARKLIR